MVQLVCIVAGAFIAVTALNMRMHAFEKTLLCALGAALVFAGIQGIVFQGLEVSV